MGKVVILFLVLIVAVTTTLLSGIYERSEEIPKMLNGNFQDIGSYTLQYAMNKVVTGQISTDMVVTYSGDDKFEVLDGQINSIEYRFSSTVAPAKYIADNPDIEGEDDGYFVYDITTDGVGAININPGNSDNTEFYMETPEGIIDRTIIHTNAPEFGYTGPASLIKVKPKALGRMIKVNGVDLNLNTNTRYTFDSDNMYVVLWNDHIKDGKAMGKWWINIDYATDAVLSLDPGIPLEDFVQASDWSFDDDTFSHIEVDIIANVSMEVQNKVLTHGSRAGAVVVSAENEDVFWWTANQEVSKYKVNYWNP
jgi:hypothetical protein